jgi:hypothetical protein
MNELTSDLIGIATAGTINATAITSGGYTGNPTIDAFISFAITALCYLGMVLLKWAIAKVKAKVKKDKELTKADKEEILKDETKK